MKKLELKKERKELYEQLKLLQEQNQTLKRSQKFFSGSLFGRFREWRSGRG